KAQRSPFFVGVKLSGFHKVKLSEPQRHKDTKAQRSPFFVGVKLSGFHKVKLNEPQRHKEVLE
ncbi:MAG: hypothetical protein ACRCT1_17660, partial [Microcoleaceae cyanobacterium]